MTKRQLFGTDGIRGLANVAPLDVNTSLRIGQAAARYFQISKEKQSCCSCGGGKARPLFVIGRDSRISGEILQLALAAGLASMGADVKLIGIVPTPAVAVMTRQMGADAGVVITASHNPAEDNGIKFFSASGHKLPDEVELELENLIFNDKLDTSAITGAAVGKIEHIDCQKAFCDFLTQGLPGNCLAGLKIVVDCANGAAFQVAPQVFTRLGAKVVVVNAQPDGMNINLNCGAMHPEATGSVVVAEKADFGVTFDGDADRLIMIDEKGEIVDGDITIYLLAMAHKAAGQLDGNAVVVTHYTNLALDAKLKESGIKTVRVDNGDRYVIQEMLKSGYVVGGEKSGHIILSRYNSTGDGVLSALHFAKMVKDSGRKLSAMAAELSLYPQLLDKVDVKDRRPLNEIPGYSELAGRIERELGDSGRLLVRYSGTQNVCRVMLEGPDENKLREYNELVKKVLKGNA